jgi:hypothetical protein
MSEPTTHRAGTSVVLFLLSFVFSAHARRLTSSTGSIGGLVTDEQASALRVFH